MSAQGTPEWLQERCGCATASKFADILATTKSGPAASRTNYLTQLALERLTGQVQEAYVSPAMQDGTAMEPYARAAFELRTGFDVLEVGFLKCHEWIGCSPDGLIDEDAGLEIKCPIPATHLKTLLAGKMPADHVAQVQGSMFVTGRSRWHFVSYNSRFPDSLRLFHCIIERDEAYIANLEKEVHRFLEEVDAAVNKLNELREAA